MDKIIKLRKEMNDWLGMECLSIDSFPIAECFRLANDLDEWKVKLFYATFAPYMANVLDDIAIIKESKINQDDLVALLDPRKPIGVIRVEDE